MSALPAIDAALPAIFERLFGLDPASLNDQVRRGELERWDSLGHLELLEALRLEFGVEIPPEQGLDMETVADVKRILRSMGAGG